MKFYKALVAACALGAFTWAPMSYGVDDAAFDTMVNHMRGQDTGSLWFDYYVAKINQDISTRDSREAYGAAGVNGPISGFDGYLSSFVIPDTGSIWFNDYVDAVNHVIWEKRQ